MHTARSRVCLGCKETFEANRRNARHQKYCSAPACRMASKIASQRLWTAKPENRNYHRGPLAVARVRNWQNVHPEYRARQKAQRSPALQDLFLPQATEFKDESTLALPLEALSAAPVPAALQDFIST